MSICSHALPPMRGVRWNAHRSSFFFLLQKMKHFLPLVFSFLQRAIWHSAFWWALCTFYVCLFPYHFRTTHILPVLRYAYGHCWNGDEHFSHHTLTAQSSAWFGMLRHHFFPKEGNVIFFCSFLDDIIVSICILEEISTCFLSRIPDTWKTRSPRYLQFTASRSSWLCLFSIFLCLFFLTALLFWHGLHRPGAKTYTTTNICNFVWAFETCKECQKPCSEPLLKFVGVGRCAGVERPSCRKIYILDFHLTVLIRCSRKPTYFRLCRSLEIIESYFSFFLFCLTFPMLARLFVISIECLIEPSFHFL